MESILRIVKKFNKGEIDETEMQMSIILLENPNITTEDEEHKEEASPMSWLKELALKSAKFYNEKIGLSS